MPLSDKENQKIGSVVHVQALPKKSLMMSQCSLSLPLWGFGNSCDIISSVRIEFSIVTLGIVQCNNIMRKRTLTQS